MGKQRNEKHTQISPHRSSWSSRLVPSTLLGYALTALSIVIVGVCVYAVSGIIRDLTGSGLAAPGAPGSGGITNPREANDNRDLAHELFLSEAPGGGKKLGQTKIAGGVKVTLVRTYADVDSVVVGYTLEDLRGGRRLGGHPVELQPGYSNNFRLTDESGNEFTLVDEGGAISPGPNNIQEGPLPHVAVFEPERRIKPDGKHRFRLEIPVLKVPLTSPEQPKNAQAEATPTKTTPAETAPEPRRVGKPLAIGFETPVKPAPVVNVDQEATADGITLTLERVTDSPGQPEAVVCLNPRDSVHGWYPVGGDLATEVPNSVPGEGNCLEVLLEDPLNGPSSVTVAEIEKGEKVIRGPWRFEFEMSGP